MLCYYLAYLYPAFVKEKDHYLIQKSFHYSIIRSFYYRIRSFFFSVYPDIGKETPIA